MIRKVIVRGVTGGVLLLMALTAQAPNVSAAGCGIVPIKPIPPIGCKDLKPECVCDSTGQKCSWVWKCVTR